MSANSEHWYTEWSDRTLLIMKGYDGVDFLQRLSTNDMAGLKSGHMRTVLTNEKGKIIDVLTVVQLQPDCLLLSGVSKEEGGTKNWLERFIIMEDITVEPASNYRHFLLGTDLEGQIAGVIKFQDLWGMHFLVNVEDVGAFLKPVGEKMRRADEEFLEVHRLQQGIPEWKSELSAEYNPLEAGLDDMVSWTKGCYIGQEVIARLDTYKKVQRHLVRLVTTTNCRAPTNLYIDDTIVGTITSMGDVGNGKYYGLAYLKTSVTEGKSTMQVRQDGESKTVEIREH